MKDCPNCEKTKKFLDDTSIFLAEIKKTLQVSMMTWDKAAKEHPELQDKFDKYFHEAYLLIYGKPYNKTDKPFKSGPSSDLIQDR